MDFFDIYKKLSVGTIRSKKSKDVVRETNNKNVTKQPVINEVAVKGVKRKSMFIQKEEGCSSDEAELTLLGDIRSNGIKGTDSERKNKDAKRKKTKKEKDADLRQEHVNRVRNAHRITVVGVNPPPPAESFEQLHLEHKVSQVVIRNLRSSGYDTPTPIQMQAIPAMVQGREVLACAPTGSGKTAAFLVPVLHHLRSPSNAGLRALVVCPTRELARQIYQVCTWLSEGTGLRAQLIKKASLVPGKLSPEFFFKCDILITTPNRIVYLLKQEPPVVSLKSVEWLIVDEADKLFECGARGFRDQLAEVHGACGGGEGGTTLRRAMFSATYTVHVARWCRKHLRDLVAVTVGHRNTAVDLVKQELIFVGNEHGKLVEFRNIVQQGLPPPVLVFVQSKERAQELFKELIYDGINVDVIHADRSQTQRDNTVRAFREGKIWVLICTELMGRGIDFKGVNLVINYDFPTSAISYIHRIGRTGRAGRRGRAVTFFTETDRPTLRSIATVMRDSGCEVPEYTLALKRTSKRERRKIERSAPEREAIDTTPRHTLVKRKRLAQRIQSTKRKKAMLVGKKVKS